MLLKFFYNNIRNTEKHGFSLNFTVFLMNPSEGIHEIHFFLYFLQASPLTTLFPLLPPMWFPLPLLTRIIIIPSWQPQGPNSIENFNL